MSDFLARYESGEHEQVWEELVALGEQVRAEPLSDEALAVAHETMRRTRHNIELLIPRLVAVGYQFGYGWIQPFIRERLIRPYSANYDPASGKFAQGVVVEPSIPNAFSVKQRLAYEEYLESARDQPPLFTPATDAAERIAYLEGEIADAQERIAQLKRDVSGFLAGPGGARSTCARCKRSCARSRRRRTWSTIWNRCWGPCHSQFVPGMRWSAA